MAAQHYIKKGKKTANLSTRVALTFQQCGIFDLNPLLKKKLPVTNG